jgi:hypothetical protein
MTPVAILHFSISLKLASSFIISLHQKEPLAENNTSETVSQVATRIKEDIEQRRRAFALA